MNLFKISISGPLRRHPIMGSLIGAIVGLTLGVVRQDQHPAPGLLMGLAAGGAAAGLLVGVCLPCVWAGLIVWLAISVGFVVVDFFTPQPRELFLDFFYAFCLAFAYVMLLRDPVPETKDADT